MSLSVCVLFEVTTGAGAGGGGVIQRSEDNQLAGNGSPRVP
jgi:hypothetical protein